MGKVRRGSGRKLETLELSLFCHQLALVLKSGVHPAEGLPLVAEEAANPLLRAALHAAGESVLQGGPLHQSLSDTGVFPPYLVSMVRLGETAGMLERVTDWLGAFYEKEDRMAKRLRAAMAYPLLLMVLMTGILVLLVVEVLPMFARILSSLGGELPVVTRAMLGFGNWFSQFGVWLLLGLVILLFASFLLFRRGRGREKWDEIVLKTPGFGRVLTKTYAARFSQGLSLVLQSGMELVEGLEEARDLIANRHVRKQIDEVIAQVREGADLGTALAAAPLFPPLFMRMIRLGQKSGELDQMMGKVASIHEGEVEHAIRQFSNALEPILVIILSCVAGGMLLAVMLPLINIMGTIG